MTARLNYFESRVAQTLYGGQGPAVRWHRESSACPADAAVAAVEILQAPAFSGERTGLAVLHLRFGADPVGDLAGLCDLSSSPAGAANRSRLQALMPDGVTIPSQVRRASTLAHVTFGGAAQPTMSPAYGSWPARDQWLWCLASAAPESLFPPDPEDPSLFEGRVRFSADWQALVLRDGVAFVGTSPDPGGENVFHAAAETYVHSIYLDVLLLGRMQANALNTLANQIATIGLDRLGAGQLEVLEGRLIELRRTFGRDHITAHGKGNEILRQYFAQHRVPELRARLVDDLADTARYVEAAGARSVNAVLGLVTVLGLPFGLSYAAGALWGGSGARSFAVWTAVGAVASLAAVLLPPVRAMLRAISRRIDD
ncbi:hypothetical protein [Streptomyces sp. NBC_01190]|uniref:hypothetical protein n=1 Tax=Streptomyces sp. NBC_01190 TaxID=2903767 RepID=UPI00386C7C84|nr:hypothetical protein OG519_08350 [Streptomyces sp. NBC_01190]